MAQETPRTLDAAKATEWLWKTCEVLDKMQAAGFFQVKDILHPDALQEWINEKQVRSMEENARKKQATLTMRRREVLSRLSPEERLALGYPQQLGKNPNYPIYHVSEKDNPDQTTATP